MTRGADGYLRETVTLKREDAREHAKAMLKKYPKSAYGTEVERWRELPGDRIEFTMKRLPTAD
jgi:hypothetical protein